MVYQKRGRGTRVALSARPQNRNNFGQGRGGTQVGRGGGRGGASNARAPYYAPKAGQNPAKFIPVARGGVGKAGAARRGNSSFRGGRGNIGRGRGGRGNSRGGRGGRFGRKPGSFDKDKLDADLDSYMMKDKDYAKKKLDSDLDDYLARRDGTKKDGDAAMDEANTMQS